MKFSFKAESRRDVWLHLFIMLTTALILVLIFFYIWLPWSTNHGEAVTVPDLNGKHIEDIEAILDEQDLEFVVEDSTFKPGVKPFLVYAQYPAPGTKVKQGRKIFISITSKNPPLVKMPNLVNRSLINAQTEIEGAGLILGQITYVKNIQMNSVIRQLIGGKEVTEGINIPKGTKVDLEIGDGLGNQQFPLEDLVGKTREEVESVLAGVGLQIGAVLYDGSSSQPQGTVLWQKPAPGTLLRAGDQVDIKVAGEDPLNSEEADEGVE